MKIMINVPSFVIDKMDIPRANQSGGLKILVSEKQNNEKDLGVRTLQDDQKQIIVFSLMKPRHY